ncbi:hypothetical protein Pelo_6256 [Pelomyxa schiedti]|nr:hypothetical protein Pelo_6256 [Pelomyxa schiedti]
MNPVSEKLRQFKDALLHQRQEKPVTTSTKSHRTAVHVQVPSEFAPCGSSNTNTNTGRSSPAALHNSKVTTDVLDTHPPKQRSKKRGVSVNSTTQGMFHRAVSSSTKESMHMLQLRCDPKSLSRGTTAQPVAPSQVTPTATSSPHKSPLMIALQQDISRVAEDAVARRASRSPAEIMLCEAASKECFAAAIRSDQAVKESNLLLENCILSLDISKLVESLLYHSENC